MCASPVTLSVIALTEAAADSLPDWRYLPTNMTFVTSPCPGVTVTIEPIWGFHTWYANSQPAATLESTLVTKAFVSVFNRKPTSPLIIVLYQHIYRNTGRLAYMPTFWEDIPNRRNEDERLVDDVPDYIAELFEDYTQYIAPRFDFTGERAFLRSLPENYTYHGDPTQNILGYLIVRCMLGDPEAIDRFVADSRVPQIMRDELASDITVLKARAYSLRLA